MKLKICGIRSNGDEVAQLNPDYLGFIFYDKSPRNFEPMVMPELPDSIKKVGVFVDASIHFIKRHIDHYQLDVIQLHSDESPDYILKLKILCEKERIRVPEIWKVFHIKDHFDFDRLLPYVNIVDKFVFDTKGRAKGGNGYTFDWNVLKDYPSKTPFILSGGIGLDKVANLKAIQTTHLPIYAIDVNSKFEIKPGLKDIEKLEAFKSKLNFPPKREVTV